MKNFLLIDKIKLLGDVPQYGRKRIDKNRSVTLWGAETTKEPTNPPCDLIREGDSLL